MEERERCGYLEKMPSDFEEMTADVSGKVILGDECETARWVTKAEN
jgi:hypothetical protein